MIEELFTYAVGIRRAIHEYPEVGFELDKTVALVSNELDKLGITYTNKYGRASIVAEIGQGEKMVALRADMDALPVEEKTGLPFSSKIPGQMHACGHDAHTAILLAVAKYLKSIEKLLPCKVRLIFQPSEEGAISGAKMLVDNGVCDGVDHIICTHCENTMKVGSVGIKEGAYMAACVPATIRFIGKSSHATLPEFGIDANAMATEAYLRLKDMVKEEAGNTSFIWCVGRIEGGHVHNVISAVCEMDISFRFYDMNFAERVEKRTKEICNNVAENYGGRCEIIWNMSTGPVCNDSLITERFINAMQKTSIHVENIEQRMSSEDFGWYLTKCPGMLFRFGTQGEKHNCITVAHNNDFCIDEDGMRIAIQAFCEYVMSL